jgi:hypothetical protein
MSRKNSLTSEHSSGNKKPKGIESLAQVQVGIWIDESARETARAPKNTGERGEWTRSDWPRQPSRAGLTQQAMSTSENRFPRKVGVTLPGQCKKRRRSSAATGTC